MPSQEGGAWVLPVLGWGLIRDWTGQKDLPDPRTGWAQTLRTRTEGPSGSFPKPTVGVRRRCRKGPGELQSFHTESYTHIYTERNTYTNRHTCRYALICTHTQGSTHGHTLICTDKCRHTQVQTFIHMYSNTLTHMQTYIHKHTHT